MQTDLRVEPLEARLAKVEAELARLSSEWEAQQIIENAQPYEPPRRPRLRLVQ